MGLAERLVGFVRGQNEMRGELHFVAELIVAPRGVEEVLVVSHGGVIEGEDRREPGLVRLVRRSVRRRGESGLRMRPPRGRPCVPAGAQTPARAVLRVPLVRDPCRASPSDGLSISPPFSRTFTAYPTPPVVIPPWGRRHGQPAELRPVAALGWRAAGREVPDSPCRREEVSRHSRDQVPVWVHA